MNENIRQMLTDETRTRVLTRHRHAKFAQWSSWLEKRLQKHRTVIILLGLSVRLLNAGGKPADTNLLLIRQLRSAGKKSRAYSLLDLRRHTGSISLRDRRCPSNVIHLLQNDPTRRTGLK